MSRDKKSAIEKVASSLGFERLSENEAGQLAGGFSDALPSESLSDGGFELNISKCKCTITPPPPASA